MSATILAAILTISQTAPVIVTAGEDPCPLGASALAQADDGAQLERLTRCDISAVRDPAVQINHAVAAARLGDDAKARQSFDAAARNAERFELETVAGEWLDSRVLARRGLALLDEGAFDKVDALAVR